MQLLHQLIVPSYKIIMMATLLLAILSFVFGWQLVKVVCKSRQRRQLAQQQMQQYMLQLGTLESVQEQNRIIAHHLYDTVGHSIAALHIQLQVAHKLWQLDPGQAQQSLSEAYQLSMTLMQEVRQTVKTLNQDSPKELS